MLISSFMISYTFASRTKQSALGVGKAEKARVQRSTRFLPRHRVRALLRCVNRKWIPSVIPQS